MWQSIESLFRPRVAPRWFAPFLLCLLFLGGLLLRLGPYLHRDLWEDELFSIAFAQRITNVPVHILHPNDDRPPLFYLVVKALLAISDDPHVLRLTGLIPSLLCIPLAYYMFHKRSKKVALFVSGWMAFAPYLIEYSWQLRDYGLLLPVALLSTWFALQWLERAIQNESTEKYAWLLCAVNGLGCGINYIYLLYVGSLLLSVTAIYVVANLRGISWRKFGQLLAVHALIAAVAAFYLLQQHRVIQDTTTWIPWMTTKGVEQMIATAGGAAFAFDEVFVQTRLWVGYLAWFVVGVFVISVGIVTAVKRHLPQWIMHALWLGLLTMCINVLAVYVVSQFLDRSIFLPRTLLPAVVTLTVSLAVVTYVLWNQALNKWLMFLPAVVWCVGIVGFAYADMYTDRHPTLWGDWRVPNFQHQQQVVNFIENDVAENGVLFFPYHYQELYSSAYFSEVKDQQMELLKKSLNGEVSNFPKSGKKIYFVVTQTLLDEAQSQLYYPKEYRDKNFSLLQHVEGRCANESTVVLSNEFFVVKECTTR